jgi:hypothetical protein
VDCPLLLLLLLCRVLKCCSAPLLQGAWQVLLL